MEKLRFVSQCLRFQAACPHEGWKQEEAELQITVLADNQSWPTHWRPPGTLPVCQGASDDTQQLLENKLASEPGFPQTFVTLTNGADYAGVARCDWLLVDVQQTQMFQEGVSHAGIELLALNKGVRHCHQIWIAPKASCGDTHPFSGIKLAMKLYWENEE